MHRACCTALARLRPRLARAPLQSSLTASFPRTMSTGAIAASAAASPLTGGEWCRELLRRKLPALCRLQTAPPRREAAGSDGEVEQSLIHQLAGLHLKQCSRCPSSPAQLHCSDCDRTLCSTCAAAHRQDESTATHTLTSISSAEQSAKGASAAVVAPTSPVSPASPASTGAAAASRSPHSSPSPAAASTATVGVGSKDSTPSSTPSKKRSGGGGRKSSNGSSDAADLEAQQRMAQLESLLPLVHSGELAGLEVDLGSRARAVAHQMAEGIGLEHESLGYRPRRHLYITKPYEPHSHDLYLVFRMGHLFVEGGSIDAMGCAPHALVDSDAAFREHRSKRDGMHHHITIIHSGQMEMITHVPGAAGDREGAPAVAATEVSATAAAATGAAAAASTSDSDAAVASPSSPSDSAARVSRAMEERVLNFFAAQLNTSPRDLGLGRTILNGDMALYRVIQWEQINALRNQLGLPNADLHVTVGFKAQDIHGVRKDRHTLIQPSSWDDGDGDEQQQ